MIISHNIKQLQYVCNSRVNVTVNTGGQLHLRVKKSSCTDYKSGKEMAGVSEVVAETEKGRH